MVVASGNTVYDSRENCNAIIETSTNRLIAGCKNTVIPESVTSIGDYAFYGCSGLTSITIPEGVTSIGGSAFYGCSGLTSITIPEGVTSIENFTFYNCSSLTSITIPEGVTSFGRHAFLGCSSLASITIPESVTSIDVYTFYGCSSLTSITIPEGVTSIGGSAFSSCTNLTSVTMKNPTPVTIDSGSFSNRANATLYVPAGSKAAYEGADYWKEFKEIVEMPSIETFAVMLDGVEQTLKGTWVVQDNNDYIVTESGTYRVKSRKERSMGDVNGDDKITIADMTALVNVILGSGSVGPAVIYDVESVGE